MPSTCIIAYDIADSRRRSAILQLLRRWRIGGQLSVHECRLTQQEASALFEQLARKLDSKEDSLLLAWTDLRQRRGSDNQAPYSSLKVFR